MKMIAKTLGVSVSSVSLWTRDIALTEEQLEALRQSNHRLDGQRAGSSARGESARDARRRAQLDSKRRRRLHPYGTIRIQVHSTFIVQSIYGAIQEYTGVEQPEWLD